MLGIDNFLLIAIPMFILAGNVMERGYISRRLIALAGSLLRRFRSGLPNSMVLGEMFFSGISGSTVADISAMAAMVVPAHGDARISALLLARRRLGSKRVRHPYSSLHFDDRHRGSAEFIGLRGIFGARRYRRSSSQS